MAAHLITPRISADEFIRLCEEDEDKYQRFELIDGEICEREMNGYTHDRVKNNIKELFDRAMLDRAEFKCWIEHSFKMMNSSIFTPDVALISPERLAHRTGNSPTQGAPEIAFEVTISDSASKLRRKIDLYLASGALAVCCVYPELRSVVVYSPNRWRELTEGHVLEFPELLAGITLPIAPFFEGI